MATVIKEREEIKTDAQKKPSRKEETREYPRFWDEQEDAFGLFRHMSDYCQFWNNYHTTSFNILQMWGEYTMKMWDTFVDQSMYFQKEGRNLFQEWMETYQGICNDYQHMGEKNFESFSTMFKQ